MKSKAGIIIQLLKTRTWNSSRHSSHSSLSASFVKSVRVT